MSFLLDEISEITIYIKKEGSTEEKINEVALYQPLAKTASLDEKSTPLLQRKWSFAETLPLSHRLILKIQTFFLQKFSFFVNDEKKSPEAKFKTVLAILLSQEALLDFFLKEIKERDSFFKAISDAAQQCGYHDFSPPSPDLPYLEISRALTTLSSKDISLIDDPDELNRQMALIHEEERDEILFHILNNIKRFPLTSVLEIHEGNTTKKIAITTVYKKYKIIDIDPSSGRILFEYKENETQSGIIAKSSRAFGAINQHLFFDTTIEPNLLGGACGELLTKERVLEQTLFLLQVKDTCFLEEADPFLAYEEKSLLFTSLFSWNEYDKILDEYYSIEEWQGKVLKVVLENGETKRYLLNFYFHNIPFNAFNKFPAPHELNASLIDINTRSLISLVSKAFDKINITNLPLKELIYELNQIKKETDFLKKEQNIINVIECFRPMQKELIKELDLFLSHPTSEFSSKVIAYSVKELLSQKKSHGKSHTIDTLIYLSLLSKYLNICHNKNCDKATDRTAGAISIDKAQNAFIHIVGKPFLPHLSTAQETSLFKVLYSMYLVFEEPELNAGLCTGFVGEKFYRNFIQKNPETTHYLIPWLQKHPEMYLGLSSYRS